MGKWLSEMIEGIRRALDAAMGVRPEDQDLDVACACKGRERYVWMFTSDRADEAIDSIRRMAADPDLSLNDLDADYLVRRIRAGHGAKNGS